ncbi:MAG: PAS domain S-box protein [Desulfuromonadales bacterium]|nr:PAS domain S-box protein [Desulfuromonadales bacterium]
MGLRHSLKISIQSRLVLAMILSAVSFAVIATVLLISFVQVHKDITQLVETQLSQTVANSQLAATQSTSAARNTTADIDRTIVTSGAIVLALLLVLAVLLGAIYINLFNHHIKKPMETIRQRLLAFRQGDYNSPMPLDREDEWGQIEEVFNDMLTDLLKSWSTIQESEQRYRHLFDNATEGIFQSSISGEFLNVNPAMAQMFGYSSVADLKSCTNLREQIYADPRERDRLIEEMQQHGFVHGREVQMRRKNGELFWVAFNGHQVLGDDGQTLSIEGTLNDTSERRQAEESLRKLQADLQNIVDSMPSVLIGVNPELNVTLWNRQAEDMSGIASAQAVGQKLTDVYTLIDPVRYLSTLETVWQNSVPARLQKIPGVWQGNTRYFNLLIYPLSLEGSSGLVIHIDDVTEKAQIEDIMMQSEKMLSVGSLAAGMAHEINNPLAVILQNVQVMGSRLSPSLDKNRRTAEELGMSIEQVAEYTRLRGFDQMIQSISSAGQRAARIIENMLSFSRKSRSEFIPCSLVDLLEKTIELAASDYDMKHHYDFRTIRIVRDFQPVPDVPCEPGQIQQVILNLLKNAAQAFARKSEDAEIRVRIFMQAEQVCLQVEDNGPGMDETTRKRVFEPFYTTKEVGIGTGLGLSVAYFIVVENHRGRLTVTSKPGEGSCFSLYLPLKREDG